MITFYQRSCCYTEDMVDLRGVAERLMEQGKGILAADESVHTADARLKEYGIEASEEMRRRDRELFLAAPGIEKYLSGAILFSETVTQKADTGVLFPELLAERGILPGIKVDLGTEQLADGSKEVITQGLIGLPERLTEFAAAGLAFTKWRAVIRIDGDKLPTAHALVENAKRLAQYARLVQQARMVPILEPEVLLEGTHSRQRAKIVITQILKTVFAALEDQAVDVSCILVKTAMALSGKTSGKHDTPEEVAEDTLEALMAAVPKDVPGIVFLSGGQSPTEATGNLRAICKRARDVGAPWPLTYSFARALQEEALALWSGKEENVPRAHEAYLARLAAVSTALRG
jgi:fructose-bisphosphate aldolase class I